MSEDGKPVRARQPGRDAPPEMARRFYEKITVCEVEAGFTVMLDGRMLKTPRKEPFIVPGRRLADAVAAEWEAQGERIDPASMPLTRLCNSAIDVVLANAAALRAEVVAYAMNDALCYRAEAPADLVARQAALWDPVLAWAERAPGASLVTTAGILHVEQPAPACAAIKAAVDAVSPWRLAAVHLITTLTGSALLALALEARAIDAEAAWEAAHVDEDHQIALWGEDAEAAARRAGRWRDMAAAARLLASG